MPFPSVFPLPWVLLTAAIAFVASVVVLIALNRRAQFLSTRDCIVIALVVGLSVFAWRYTGNIPVFNDDTMPPFSPNDLLCPLITYLFLSVYAALRRPADLARWAQARALLTIVSFVVNILVI